MTTPIHPRLSALVSNSDSSYSRGGRPKKYSTDEELYAARRQQKLRYKQKLRLEKEV